MLANALMPQAENCHSLPDLSRGDGFMNTHIDYSKNTRDKAFV